MFRIVGVLLLCLNVASAAYWGFDRNIYPGDAALPALHKSFSFTGYWLNTPPGDDASSWLGKRSVLKKTGFGFLVLFNGRLSKELNAAGSAERLGKADGEMAAKLAKQESFPPGAIVFLDQEEGGRLLPAQLLYVMTWINSVTSHGYRAGVYCSGIPFREGDGTMIDTATQIHDAARSREIHFFVYNDACPPSPGCSRAAREPVPGLSGIPFAEVWQLAQSPRRRDLTVRCASTYTKQNLCVAPGTTIDIDLSTANSADPSNGR